MRNIMVAIMIMTHSLIAFLHVCALFFFHFMLQRKLDASHNKLGANNDSHVLFREVDETQWTFTLRRVHLQDNKLSCIPPELCRLKRLERLDVSNNLIESLEPDVEWDCEHLTSLSLGSNQLGREAFTALPGRFLVNIGDRPFSARRARPAQGKTTSNKSGASGSTGNSGDRFFLPASGVPVLRELDLSDNGLAEVPECVCELKSLTFLNLAK